MLLLLVMIVVRASHMTDTQVYCHIYLSVSKALSN